LQAAIDFKSFAKSITRALMDRMIKERAHTLAAELVRDDAFIAPMTRKLEGLTLDEVRAPAA